MIIEMGDDVFPTDPRIIKVIGLAGKARLHPVIRNGDGQNVVVVLSGDTEARYNDPSFVESLLGLPGVERIVKIPDIRRLSILQGNMRAIRSLLSK